MTPQAPLGLDAVGPADKPELARSVGAALTIRNRRFSRDAPSQRWWLDNDPIATAWFNALSLTFPRGEAMFIDAVRHFREGTDPRLAEQIRAFIQQEVNHTREHVAFNRGAVEGGYAIEAIMARIERLVQEVYERPPIVWLGITMALEHFTAMFAHELLSNPRHFIGSKTEQAEIWQWHAVEEIEHKAVAYDTWRHATREWSDFRRWWVRSALMLNTTYRFFANRTRDALELLAQDGITGWRARAALWHYLLVKPGIMRSILPSWLAYFRPGFHPWDIDDSALIARYDERAITRLPEERQPG